MRDLAGTKADLLGLADEPALQSRSDDLRSLSNALGSDDAFLWAKLDLFDVFGPDAIEVPSERKDANRVWWFEFLRNLCILLPLLITWVGIALAARAYGAMLETNPAAAEIPFIQLWESGFDGQTFSIPFSTIGLLDVLAILLVVGFSVGTGWFRRQLDVTVSMTERTMWARLRATLTDASLHLARNALDTPARFNEELTQVATSLKATATQVRSAAKSVNDVLTNLDESSTRIESSLATFATDNNRHADGVNALVDAANSIGQWQAHLANTTTALSTKADELLTQQRVTTERVAEGLVEQSASSRALGEYAGLLASSSIGQTDAANRFLDGLEAERQAQEQLVANWAATTDAMNRGAQQLSALTAQLQVTTASLQGTTAEIPDRLAAAYSDVQINGAELKTATADLAARFETITSEFASASAALTSAAQSIPANTSHAQHEMQTQLVNWQQQTASASSNMGITAERLAATAEQLPHGLSTSVDQLREALTGFEAAIAGLRGLSGDLHVALTAAGQGAGPR